MIKLCWLINSPSHKICSFTVFFEPNPPNWYDRGKAVCPLSIQTPFIIYSTVFLFVRVFIQPFLTLTPSTLLPTLPLLDRFHLMSWKRWPIRFRHLSETRGFPCSITVLVSCLHSLSLLILWFQVLLQFSRETLDSVLFFSQDPTPFGSNLIDMNESAKG